jgi:hypothetical protein
MRPPMLRGMPKLGSRSRGAAKSMSALDLAGRLAPAGRFGELRAQGALMPFLNGQSQAKFVQFRVQSRPNLDVFGG